MGRFGLALIQITLILLKAFHVIDWSWVMVFFPMWLGIGILVVAFIFFFLIGLIIAVIKLLP